MTFDPRLIEQCLENDDTDRLRRSLQRIVRPPPRAAAPAEPLVAATFAYCLIRDGSVDEGMALLDAIDEKDCLEVALFRAHGHLARWDHRSAVPLLVEYLRKAPAGFYRRWAERTLGAALIDQGPSAAWVLRRIQFSTSLHGGADALARVLRIVADSFVANGRTKEALAFLSEAERVNRFPSPSERVARSFTASLVGIRQHPESNDALAALRAVRERAREMDLGEMVRRCDFEEAVVRHDENLAARVYLGSPFPALRQRLCDAFGRTEAQGFESYRWGAAEPHPRELDLESGRLRDGSAELRMKSLGHRLLVALLTDFYRTPRWWTIYARAHGAMPMDLAHARGALHDGMWRLRRWLVANHLPLDIVENDGVFRAVPRDGYSILITGRALDVMSRRPVIERLRAHFGERPFTRSEAEAALGIPRASMLRQLHEALAAGLIKRDGSSRSTRYVF